MWIQRVCLSIVLYSTKQVKMWTNLDGLTYRSWYQTNASVWLVFHILNIIFPFQSALDSSLPTPYLDGKALTRSRGVHSPGKATVQSPSPAVRAADWQQTAGAETEVRLWHRSCPGLLEGAAASLPGPRKHHETTWVGLNGPEFLKQSCYSWFADNSIPFLMVSTFHT